MRYAILQQAIKEITESHKANLTFVTGLESDIDTESEQYPIIFLQPPSSILTLASDTVGSDTWQIHLEAQEMLDPESSVSQKQEALDRTREYLKDIVHQFVYTYGQDGKTVTIENTTETLDFKAVTTGQLTPFIDLGDNISGHLVDFSIQEEGQANLCHLNDVFN